MRKFLKRHQKKFLAFCMIVLMISFAASSGNRANNSRNDVVLGRIGNTKIYFSESQQAHAEWNALNREVLIPSNNPYTGQPMEHPLAANLFPTELLNSDKASDLFMLLRHEARESGVQANNDEVQSILTNYYHRPEGADDSLDDVVRDAVTDFLLIESNFNRIASSVKVSQPERDNFLAQAGQAIQLNVVELSQSDFINKAPPPTTQQSEEQFAKYADVIPGHPDEKNPFGFGYRFPNGVKLQYLALNIDEARKTVEATQTPYDWDVKARLYYLQHKDEFATTQPTASIIGPTSQPSIKPYSQVAQQALENLRKPLVVKLMFDVQGKITSTMQNDWRVYTQSGAAGGSSASYPSYAYLNNLAHLIQTQFGMKVYATEKDRDFLSEKDLADLPGIGPTTNGRLDFAPYAIQLATAFLARSDKDSASARAQLMQPAAPLKDNSEDIYIFRLTDARPAQPAPSLAEVAMKVDADLRFEAAYRLAQAAAAPLLAAAQHGGLPAAAAAMGKSVRLTPSFTNPFGRGPAYLGDDISLSDTGEKAFVQQSFALLSQYQPNNDRHPARLIEIPEDGKVYVAQLAELSPRWEQNNFFTYSLMADEELHRQQLMKLRNGWMQYDAAVQRLGYKPESDSKDSNS